MQTTTRRLRTLTALLERHWIQALPAETPAGEEAAAYLTGAAPCKQFALISLGPEAAPAFRYVDADFDTLLAAMHAASEQIKQATHPELPLEIVNLDTGERWVPEYDQLAWRVKPHETSTTTHISMKVDSSDTEYEPLEGVSSADASDFRDLHAAIRSAGFKSVTLAGQVHAEDRFADAWNRLARQYTAGTPTSGTRMRKLVSRCADSLSADSNSPQPPETT